MKRVPECWTPVLWAGDASPQRLVDQAVQFEREGWDGITCADTQCIMPEAFVVLMMIALRTQRLKMTTGVTVPLTRHPAVTASAIAAIQAVSKGRAELGIGRGDTALAYLGASPVRLNTFERFVRLTNRYLAGELLPLAEVVPTGEGAIPGFGNLAVGTPPPGSRLVWLDPSVPKVPVEVAATGPKTLAMAGRVSDRVALNLGVDPVRVKWGIDTVRQGAAAAGRDPQSIGISLYASVVPCTDNKARVRELVRPFVLGSSRFAVMDRNVPGHVSAHQREVLEGMVDSYDITQHVRKGQTRAGVDDEFIDSYAIIGPADHCVDRLLELVSLGVDRFVMTYATPDNPEYDDTRKSLVEQVFPALRRAG